MTTAPKKTIPLSVAEYVTLQIEASGKLQSTIAKEVGFDKPNVITMIKQGKTKLPLGKIGPMARSLGVDALHLMKITFLEYFPETWEQIESAVAGQLILTENELDVLNAMRKAGLGTRRLTGDQTRDIVKFLKTQLPKD